LVNSDKDSMKPYRYQLVVIFWLLFLVHASATVRYVNVNNSSPASPYTSWATAATNIQDGIDAANPGDQVLVTNGVYKTGGQVSGDGTTNRVVVANPVALQSVNGSAVTVINGAKTMRCVYLTDGAMMSGFTLTNGNAGNGGGLYCTTTNALISNCTLINNTASSGGGAYSGTLTNCTLSGNKCSITGGNGGGATASILVNCTLIGNVTGRQYPNSTGASWGGGASGCTLNGCVLSGNSAYGAGSHGGGASGSSLNNCTLANNYTEGYGGGAYGSTLNNCVLSGNYGIVGGGADEGTLNNCTLFGNRSAGNGSGGTYYLTANNSIIFNNTSPDNIGSTLNYCCTPDGGDVGCITNAPLFVNQNGGDLHLQTYSPCINAGNNAYVATSLDRDGNPRIVGGTVDMGAYENQSATESSGLPSVPTNLVAVRQAGQAVLSWSPSLKATGYNINRAETSDGIYTIIASGVATTNYNDATVINGGTYYYYVTAVNAYGESAGSQGVILYFVDHFAFAPISSPQTSSVPFTVTVSACDSSGRVLSNFNGAAMLSAAGDHGDVPLTPTDAIAFLDGLWTGEVTMDSAFPDTNVHLNCSSNGVAGVSNPFNVVAPAIQLFNLTAADLVYNPFTQRLYAAVPAATATFSNSLVVIDPVMGRVETSYYLGDDPGHLAVSSDGQFVYIGFNGTNVFRRFNLATHTVDLQVELVGTANIAALPGLPHSVAVTSGGIAIFDDGVQRSNTYPFGSFAVPGSANELFTMGGGYPAAPFARLTVDASGVADYTFEDGIVGWLETFKYQAGLIFTSGGTVFNPDTANILGHLTNCSIVEPDLAAGRIFTMGSHPVWAQPPGWTLYAWDATSLQMVGSLAIPGVNDGGPTTLIRWGTNGVAFSISSWYQNQLFLVRTPLVPTVPPVLIGGSRQASGPFQLDFTGDQSVPYTVWASTNLANWTPLGPANLVSNGWFWFWDINATNYWHRFYRAGISP
jgi:hypothetical protein